MIEMPTEKPKVSICIPNYNYGSFIGDAIQSALEQTYKNFELVIVDNCSTDDSEEVIKSFSDPRIRYFKNDRNIGGIRNWNRCLSLARGEYITLLHADDKLIPNLIEKETKILDRNPTVGLVHSSCIFIDGKGAVIGEYHPFDKDHIIRGEDEFKRLVLNNYLCVSSVVMVRKKCYDALGDFSEEYTYCPDWEMWLRIALNYDMSFISEPLGYYRKHGASGMDSYLLNRRMNIARMDQYKMFKEIFSNLPSDKKYLSSFEQEALKKTAKRMIHTAFEDFCQGNSRLARQNIALAIAIDDSCLKSIKVFIFFIVMLFKGDVFLRFLKKVKILCQG
jgi:glycosyltransferase involved in cell wall biosynthesis